jgi:hypothetical protein
MSTEELQGENCNLRELLWHYHRATEHCMLFGNGVHVRCGDVDFQRDSIENLAKHEESV